MLAPRTKRRIYLQSFLDGVITFSSFWVYLLIFILLFPGNPTHYIEYIDRYLVCSLIAVGAIWLQGARTMYSHPSWWMPSFHESHSLSRNQVFNVATGITLFLLATKDNKISQLFLFSWLPMVYVTLLIANRYLPGKVAASVQAGRNEKTVFLGSTESAEALARWKNQQEQRGFEFIEYKPDLSISQLAHLERFIRKNSVSRLILTELPELKYNLHYIADICERAGVRLMVFSNLEQSFRHKVALMEDAGIEFIELCGEPLESPHNRLLKRVLDLSVVIPVVLLGLPALAGIVFLGQRLQSRGPLLVKERRAGLKGRVIEIYRFRTTHPVDSGCPDNEEKTFSFGRWLRRTGLDHFPQFWNVLRGEMTIVGPRPHLLRHDELVAREMRKHSVRAEVKPGVVSLAKVRGFGGEIRSEEDLLRRVESDIAYLETWSFSLDLAVIARSALQRVWPPGRVRGVVAEAAHA